MWSYWCEDDGMGKHFCLNDDDDDDDEGKSQSHVGDVGPSFSSLYTQLTEHKNYFFVRKVYIPTAIYC